MESKKKSIDNVTNKAERILAGALQVFATYGYAAATMDRIAAAARVSKPTLYNYFQDKAGLFKALINQFTQDKPMAVLEESLLLQTPLRDSLKYLASILLNDFSDKQPKFTLIRLVIGESEQFPDLAQTFIKNVQKPILEKLSYLFAHHPDSKAADPEVLARMFSGSIMHYIISQEILHGREVVPMECDRFIDGLVNVLVGSS
ncbi:MAG: TetR/AcrR family transcriptional regulator [Symploca sp. SIO2E6]|nr:TetR/AcrR family transcriptional regulator [Symploca sp. SIO2E6]